MPVFPSVLPCSQPSPTVSISSSTQNAPGFAFFGLFRVRFSLFRCFLAAKFSGWFLCILPHSAHRLKPSVIPCKREDLPGVSNQLIAIRHVCVILKKVRQAHNKSSEFLGGIAMDLILFTDNIDEYLKEDDVVNYGNENIKRLADTLYQGTSDEVEYIKKAYEYVRDQISHSADIKEDVITCSASEVLEAGHGICFAKSHLLAALLRYKFIPTGFCYQKLILDDETAPVLIYHGFNGVYVKEFHKWIRLDARGNKEGVNAQFSLEKEQLAFPVRVEKGEEDGFVIYPDPDVKVLEKFRIHKTRTELWNDLPTELGYNS
jgi:transglutaminase-like putative cysteine protease